MIAIWELGNPGPAVDLHLPFKPYLGRNAFVKQGGKRRVWTGSLRVADPELRGNGIGERLTRSLSVLALKYGYPVIETHITSEYALDIKKRVFGVDRLAYTHADMGAIPETFDEAREMLVALRQTEEDIEQRTTGINLTIDLDGLDIANWEVPREVTRYGQDIGTIRSRLA